MRSTLEVIIAVEESQPATEEELRLCIVCLKNVLHFTEHSVNEMLDAVELAEEANGPMPMPTHLRMRIDECARVRESMFQARKRPMDVWLGPGNTPGNPEYEERRKMAKAVFKKATGIDLDAP
jgi:hypothetical protein